MPYSYQKGRLPDAHTRPAKVRLLPLTYGTDIFFLFQQGPKPTSVPERLAVRFPRRRDLRLRDPRVLRRVPETATPVVRCWCFCCGTRTFTALFLFPNLSKSASARGIFDDRSRLPCVVQSQDRPVPTTLAPNRGRTPR